MSRTNRQPVDRRKSNGAFNFVFKPIGLGFEIVFWLSISIIISTAIEWVGITFYWEADHAQKILQQDLHYLGNHFSTTVFGLSAEQVALNIVHRIDGFFWGSQAIYTSSGAEPMIFLRALQAVGDWSAPYLRAAAFVVMISAVRCLIILLSIAIFIIVGIAATVDGLHLRELRKVCGGVEHASIYHHAKAWVSRTLVITPVLYLAWPGSVNPNYFLLPGMFLFFLAIFVSFATFKKYL